MIFKGYNFRVNKNLVALPIRDENQNLMHYVDDGKDFYVYFGRIVKKGKKAPMHAIQTQYTWSDDGSPVYALPLKLSGHSLTNMAYGDKKQIYLMKDGRCYQTSFK